MNTIILLQVLTQCYRMAGVLTGPGRGLSGSEQEEGLHIMNALLDGIKTERWFFYQILRTLFSTVIDQKDYTIGDAGLGADWPLERPEKILSAGVLVPNNAAGSTNEAEIPVYVVESYEEYQRIVTKNTRSSLAQVIYYQASLPLGTATLWPVPNQVYSMVLYTPQTVQEFTDVMGEFIVPKGYREFLEYAGAEAVHDRYPNHVMSSLVPSKAREYKARVKAQQLTPAYMQSDSAVLNRGTYPGYAFNGRTLIVG